MSRLRPFTERLEPLQLPPNCIDRTDERTGTVTVIEGATAAKAAKAV
jgi:hypothetical protein